MGKLVTVNKPLWLPAKASLVWVSVPAKPNEFGSEIASVQGEIPDSKSPFCNIFVGDGVGVGVVGVGVGVDCGCCW